MAYKNDANENNNSVKVSIDKKENPDILCAVLYKTFTRKVYAIGIKYREKNKALPYFSLICNKAETSVKKIYV